MIRTVVGIADIQFPNYNRLDEFKAIIDKFISEMQTLKPDRIVIAGDIVHSKTNISPEAKDITQYFLRGCSSVAEKVIMIPGNHDLMENNKDRLDSLTPIVNALNCDNIIYEKNTKSVYDDNVIWSIYSIIDDNEKPTINNPKGLPVLGVYHGPVSGMYTDLGYKFESDVTMDLFSDCKAVFAGDIHKRQVMDDGNTKVMMIGSMVQQGFFETVSGHGYVVYNVEDGTHEFVDIEAPVKRKRFEVNDIDDVLNNNESWVNA